MSVIGWVGLLGFVWLTVFQLLLAAGAPLGHMAWGGAERVLSPGRRVASLASAVLALSGVVGLGQWLGLWAVAPDWIVRPYLDFLAALFTVSFVGNAMTHSRIERLHGVPLTIVLAVSSGWAAFAG